ncbi:hypothetical protein HYPSUDRAFT_92131 [Hypholoma sublateritium FD-334 SS-4]|uniref:RCC1/BLIP-II protein n=1 Tax=Hypholoma sublateritium (strain FD-334 SS-4) TaxID=945553 RepID=A0A0D2KJU8_HYPSF|nr:hypothetical protein HYPSUDRAFT_92131 [Hypholoma sublateritium FD-334 SS-4]
MSSKNCLLSSGSNAQGQLGNGSLEDSHTFCPCAFTHSPPGSLPNGTSRVIDIATGANHTLLLLETNEQRRELWGCGDGRKGQLGLHYRRTASSTGLFRKLELALVATELGDYCVKSISATWETSYAVLFCEGRKDVIISMGSDDYGDLGVGGEKKIDSETDFHVIDFSHISSLSERLEVLGIYSGQRHTVLHLDSVSGPILVGWGTSRHGQLGTLADKPFASTPQIISIKSENISSLNLGLHHTVIRYNSGELLCLGSDRKHQLEVVLTLGTEKRLALDIGCTWNGTYAVVRNEGVWSILSSGSNSHSQLGRKSGEITLAGAVAFPDNSVYGTSSLKVVCGSEHVLVLEDASIPGSSRLWGWGWNEHGNLGVGHTDDVPTPIRLYPPVNPNATILNVWGGLGTSWIFAEVVETGSTI